MSKLIRICIEEILLKKYDEFVMGIKLRLWNVSVRIIQWLIAIRSERSGHLIKIVLCGSLLFPCVVKAQSVIDINKLLKDVPSAEGIVKGLRNIFNSGSGDNKNNPSRASSSAAKEEGRNSPRVATGAIRNNQTLQQLRRSNPEFIQLSESLFEAESKIDEDLAKTSPNGIEACREKKFRFKDICLGVSIQEFSQKIDVRVIGGIDSSILKHIGVKFFASYESRQGQGALAVEKEAKCHYLSPKHYSESVEYSLPFGMMHLLCRQEFETLLGTRLKSVDYLFFNSRLYQIVINVDGGDLDREQRVAEKNGVRYASDINVPHDFYRSFYYNHMMSAGTSGEVIGAPVDSRVVVYDNRDQELVTAMRTTWTNSSDQSVFQIFMDSGFDTGQNVSLGRTGLAGSGGVYKYAINEIPFENRNSTTNLRTIIISKPEVHNRILAFGRAVIDLNRKLAQDKVKKDF